MVQSKWAARPIAPNWQQLSMSAMIGRVDEIGQALTLASGPVTDERAHALRQGYHELFPDAELPVPVEAIAEDLLGLSVEEVELDISGMLVPAARQIYVNAAEPEPRRRFTLAHELGHWVCQCLAGETSPIYCRSKDVSTAADRALEREANVFAAELLMPERSVRVAFDHGAALAERFGVSDEAMAWRLYSFGLVKDPPR
jgi:Zn-dependent peptidase ImmA (M78 family)